MPAGDAAQGAAEDGVTRWAKDVSVAGLQRDLLRSIERELATRSALVALLDGLGRDDGPRADAIRKAREYIRSIDGGPPRPKTPCDHCGGVRNPGEPRCPVCRASP